MKKPDARVVAVRLLLQVVDQGQSLTRVMNSTDLDHLQRDRALVGELVYGVLRWYWRLEAIQSKLIKKPLKAKDSDIGLAIKTGMYQLLYTRIPPHAAIATAVEVAHRQGKSWAAGLINASLRNLQKNTDTLLDSIPDSCEFRYAHPAWLCERIQQDWPDRAAEIMTGNNARAPMWLRVNTLKTSVDDYRELLESRDISARRSDLHTSALVLEEAVDTGNLPGYKEGLVSVQDGASQLVAGLMDLQPGMTVLDACAAPGGKTAHMLETRPDLDTLIALDRKPRRLQQVEQNLERLGLIGDKPGGETRTGCNVECVVGDAADPGTWGAGSEFPGRFDRILLDAPCSATGVIRRNPDIKLHRRLEDIDNLVREQARLLESMWSLLEPGGLLLYSTCSVIRAENTDQVGRFAEANADCTAIPLAVEWGQADRIGRQLLPGEAQMDGFYFALLERGPGMKPGQKSIS